MAALLREVRSDVPFFAFYSSQKVANHLNWHIAAAAERVRSIENTTHGGRFSTTLRRVASCMEHVGTTLEEKEKQARERFVTRRAVAILESGGFIALKLDRDIPALLQGVGEREGLLFTMAQRYLSSTDPSNPNIAADREVAANFRDMCIKQVAAAKAILSQ